MVAALAGALRLSPAERAHLFQLAGITPAADDQARAETVTPVVGAMVDRLDAACPPRSLIERRRDMRLLTVATVTADGRCSRSRRPVDGYFLHGTFWFSSGRNSVRMRHLAARPAVSATHLPGDELAVTVHGRAELFDLRDPARGELRQAMLDHYLPRQGPQFETWLDQLDAVARAHRGREDVHLRRGKLKVS